MSQVPQFSNIQSRIQQLTSYWRTRIDTIRSQWLSRLGGGGLLKGGAGGLMGSVARTPSRRTSRSIPSRRTATFRTPSRSTSRVRVTPSRITPARKVGVPGEKYDFSYKSRRVGTPGEVYDFSY